MLYCFGPFGLDPEERRLYRDGKPVVLRPKTLDVLLALLAKPGHLQTREALVKTVWPTTIVVEHGLTVSIAELRKALGDEEKHPRYIETVPRSGYRFIAPVTVEKDETAESGSYRRWLGYGLGTLAVVVLCVVAGLFAGRLTRRVPAARRETTASIAVLPFENLSADPANVYFVAGIQDEILTRLAGIRALKVISRTSTADYASRPTDLPAIARQLGVATVLEGSVQKAGDKVKINVQLIDARTRAHIWAQSYDRSLSNVFGVEGDVAQKIAAALSATLLPKEAARVARAPTRNPQAYLLYLKASYLDYQVFDSSDVRNSEAALARAAALYREAIAKDPHFAVAYAKLSLLESNSYWYYDHSLPIVRSARRSALQALLLDPDLPLAHVAMGYAAYYGSRDYPSALTQFEIARKSLPNNADVIAAIGFIHRRQGKWQETLAELREALTLDRRNPFRYYEIGTTLAALRDYSAADRQFRLALSVEPNDYVVMTYRVWVLMQAGKLQEARRLLLKIRNGTGMQDFIATLRFKLAWMQRKPDEALAALSHAPAMQPSAYLPYLVPAELLRARVWALKGDRTRARAGYAQARNTLRKQSRQNSQFPAYWSALGLTEAGLGERQPAIEAGVRAVRLLPVSRDAFSGPAYLVALAVIYTRVNEPAKAVKLLDELLAMSAGAYLSVQSLALDPIWDPIRKSPAFQSLLEKFQHKEVTGSTTTSRLQRRDSRSKFTRHSQWYGRTACSGYEAKVLMAAARSRSTATRTAQRSRWSLTRPAACMVA